MTKRIQTTRRRRPAELKRKGSSKSIDVIARNGKKIYERNIRDQVEPDLNGKIVALDIDSGEWAIAGDAISASDRLEALRPEAENILYVTVGYRVSCESGSISPWMSE